MAHKLIHDQSEWLPIQVSARHDLAKATSQLFGLILSRALPPLLGSGLQKADAEEVISMLAERLHKSLPKFIESQWYEANAYLNRMLDSARTDAFRRRNRHQTREAELNDQLPEPASEQDEAVASVEEAASQLRPCLIELLAALNNPQKRVLRAWMRHTRNDGETTFDFMARLIGEINEGASREMSVSKAEVYASNIRTILTRILIGNGFEVDPVKAAEISEAALRVMAQHLDLVEKLRAEAQLR